MNLIKTNIFIKMEKIKIQQGVTLIELMVTVAVVVILMSFAVPGFQQMVANNRVESTAEDLRNSILKARNKSMQDSSGHRLSFTSASGGKVTAWDVKDSGGSDLASETVSDQIVVSEYGESGSVDSIVYNDLGYIAGSEDLVRRIFTICHKDGNPGYMGKAVILFPSGLVMIKNANQSIEHPTDGSTLETDDICPPPAL